MPTLILCGYLSTKYCPLKFPNLWKVLPKPRDFFATWNIQLLNLASGSSKRIRLYWLKHDWADMFDWLKAQQSLLTWGTRLDMFFFLHSIKTTIFLTLWSVFIAWTWRYMEHKVPAPVKDLYFVCPAALTPLLWHLCVIRTGTQGCHTSRIAIDSEHNPGNNVKLKNLAKIYSYLNVFLQEIGLE